MNESTINFIRANADANVRDLALKAAHYSDVDMPLALDCIAGRQTARRKLPTWAAVDGVVYPPHISMEQCSSEFTARYKAGVAARIAGTRLQNGWAQGCAPTKLVDLTGGFGIDFSFMSRCFDEAVYVERQERLCDMARRNFRLLGLCNADVVCGDGIEYLHTLNHASLVFIDPARRDTNGGKTVAISDCTPDVMAVKDELLEKSDHLMLKLSPMLDWHKAVADLGNVSELHIVSTANECKELLLVLSASASENIDVYCVNDESVFRLTSPGSSYGGECIAECVPGAYLYEPNASIMKAGCFLQLCAEYGVGALGRNSHLFISTDRVGGFPGRIFHIDAVTTMNKKELRRNLAGISHANIAVRNFPMSAADLRHRLKLVDGGDVFMFATTVGDKSHTLVICHKA